MALVLQPAQNEHSPYAAPAEFYSIELQRTEDGALGIGIGIEAGEHVVASLLEGSPASYSQLQVRDRIISVNGRQLYPGDHLGHILSKQPYSPTIQLGVMRLPWKLEAEAPPQIEGGSADTPLLQSEVMGMQLYAQGQLIEAEPLLAAALEERRMTLGGRHPCTLAAMNSLASLQHDLGRLQEAESLYRAALATHQEMARKSSTDGPTPHQTVLDYEALITTHNLGKLLQVQGRMAEAGPFLKAALSSCKRMFGEHHEQTQALEALVSTASLLC